MRNVLLLLIVLPIFSSAQNSSDTTLDSLLTVFKTQKELQQATTAKEIGVYYKKNSQYYNAIEYHLMARTIYSKLTTENQQKKRTAMALCDLSIGANYYLIGDHKKSMEYYFKAYKVIPENLDLLLNIATLFNSQKNLEKSFYYLNLAEKVAQKTNTNLDKIWNKKSDVYFSKKDSVNGFNALKKSIEFSIKEHDLEQLAITYTNYGDLLPDSKEKIDLYLKSKAIWDRYQPDNLLAISNNISIANFYRTIVDQPKMLLENGLTKNEAINKAEGILLDQILKCKKINHKGQNLQYSLECLSYVYELKNDYKKANDYFKECAVLYDSLNSIDTKNKILNVESSFKIGEKDKEIELNQKIIEQEKKQKWYYIFGIGLLAIIGGLLLYQNQNRKKTNTKLQLLNSELDQANKIKIRFFSILNHDLRKPVANLIHFLHLQKESPELLDEESKKRMQNQTIAGAENLLSSMEDILLWSKDQMENFKPQPKLIEVSQLFNDNKKAFSDYQSITFEYLNSENIVLFTDENYLKTILRNLTSNAINVLKQTQNPTIIWQAWHENNHNYLSITDNGSGATSEEFKALYDDSQVMGIKTGLGLHLIRDLAKAIDCKITVKTALEEGTTFTLELP